MTDKDDSVQKQYNEYINKFCEKFDKGISIADHNNNTRTGFVFLFVRDISPGCIDVASNLSSDSIIKVLEQAMESTQEQIDASLGDFKQ